MNNPFSSLPLVELCLIVMMAMTFCNGGPVKRDDDDCDECCARYYSSGPSHNHHHHGDSDKRQSFIREKKSSCSHCRSHCNYATTTTVAPSTSITCNKLSAYDAIARNEAAILDTELCSRGTSGPSHALVLHLCNTTNWHHWTYKTKVVDACNRIPLYTAVGVHLGHSSFVSQDVSHFGILVECRDDGFKMITQTCRQTPFVQTVTSHHSDSVIAASQFYVLGQI